MKKRKSTIDISLGDILGALWGLVLVGGVVSVLPLNTIAIQFIWEFFLSQHNGHPTDVNGWLCFLLGILGIPFTILIWLVAICVKIYQSSGSGSIPTP